jgi:hypothetical protein
MRGIKKAFIGAVLIIVIALGAGLLFLFNNLNRIVKTAIEKKGSSAVQTAVRVDRVKIDLKRSSGAITGLTVANPEDFKNPNAFSLGEISIKIDIRSMTKDVKVIEEIIIRECSVFVEMNSEKTINLNEIKKNLAGTASAESPVQTDGSEKDKEPRWIIRRIRFSGGSISANIAPWKDGELRLNLPLIEMTNLGGNTGATPSQITKQVIGELTRRALDEVKKKAADLAVEKARDQAKSVFEDRTERSLEGFFKGK